jgi:hypothetical protein
MTWPARLSVQNRRGTAFTVWVEPWGADYTLLPGESLAILASGFTEDSYFDLAHADNEHDLKVVIAGECEDWTVFQGQHELFCGHNREFARR